MKITLLATSDTHGFIEPTNYVDSGLEKPFGIEKACTTIKNYRKAHPNEKIILLDNGDFLEGSPMAYYVAKRADKQDQQAFFLLLIMKSVINWGQSATTNLITDWII